MNRSQDRATSSPAGPCKDVQRISAAEIRRRHSAATAALRRNLICRAWLRSRAGRAVDSALRCLPAASAEIERHQARNAVVQSRRHNLAAAARASVAAAAEGEADPLYYVRDELAAQGYLPGDRAGRTA
jgi:hypothetical protein